MFLRETAGCLAGRRASCLEAVPRHTHMNHLFTTTTTPSGRHLFATFLFCHLLFSYFCSSSPSSLFSYWSSSSSFFAFLLLFFQLLLLISSSSLSLYPSHSSSFSPSSSISLTSFPSSPSLMLFLFSPLFLISLVIQPPPKARF